MKNTRLLFKTKTLHINCAYAEEMLYIFSKTTFVKFELKYDEKHHDFVIFT